MDGITITIDASTLGILFFILYKLISLEVRVKRIEEMLRNEEKR